MWLESPAPYTCSVASPKKASKLKGLKSFIAYTLIPSVSIIHCFVIIYFRAIYILQND